MFLDALLDACLDTLKVFPFLLVTYLFMEWLEHGAGKKFERAIAKGGRVGPLIGALLGVIPQCGFSGAAATLYAGRVVTLGTLIAVFASTSDEMIPIMLSEAAPPALIGGILLVKVITGIVCGLALDFVLTKTGRLHTGLSSLKRHQGHGDNDIHELCEEEGCECSDEDPKLLQPGRTDPADSSLQPGRTDPADGSLQPGRTDPAAEGALFAHNHGHHHGIFVPALKHSVNVTIFIFVVTLGINLLAEAGLEGALASVTQAPFLSPIVMALFGFIPNCAVSVGMTQLYLEGVMSGGALVSGLTVNAGIGLIVLFRTNRDFNENLRIMAVMLAVGVLAGWVIQLVGLF